jgi:hypothetical protein
MEKTKPTKSKSGRVKKIRNSDEWEAWDERDNYLGFTNDRDEAILMAEKGWTTNLLFDEAMDLELWQLWNECADRSRVWDCGDGTQALALPGHWMLMATPDETLGWEVEIMAHDDFYERYADETNNLCRVTVAEKPYRVE